MNEENISGKRSESSNTDHFTKIAELARGSLVVLSERDDDILLHIFVLGVVESRNSRNQRQYADVVVELRAL